MHIAPYDNKNIAIVGVDDAVVPLTYFNIVKLRRGEVFESVVRGYETCIVPATGSVDVAVGGQVFAGIGNRGVDVWDGEPEGVYVPVGLPARITCRSDHAEVFVAGAKFDQVLEAFEVRADALDVIQYGSDDTKTHRKIKHILGTKYHGRVGRLLVSELFTVGAGGWSGFPNHGSGVQMLQREDGKAGDAYHIVDGSTICLDRGYHPCAVLPGYEMYYFTILAGLSQRSLVQYFQPSHAHQIETIPGIKDMIAKFK